MADILIRRRNLNPEGGETKMGFFEAIIWGWNEIFGNNDTITWGF